MNQPADTIESDLRILLTTARGAMSTAEITREVATYPLVRGDKRRTLKATRPKVDQLLLALRSDNEVEYLPCDRWRIIRQTEARQTELF